MPALVCLGLLLAAGPVKDARLVRQLGVATVDWAEGVVTARAVAAADLRFPGVQAVREAGVRRARERAARSLRAALGKLPWRGQRRLNSKAIDQALERAQIVDVEYQSNGGVRLVLGVRFQDLSGKPLVSEAPGARQPPREPAVGEAPTAAPSAREAVTEPRAARPAPPEREVVLAVASMPFEVAPVLLAGGKEFPLESAAYRLGAPPRGSQALAVRRDQRGRLVLPARTAAADLAGARAIIFVRRPGRR